LSAEEIDGLRRHLAAEYRLTRELIGRVQSLLTIRGPDPTTRRQLREAAMTVISPSSTPLEKQLAATTLALKVLESIPAPRPVAVPVVSVEEEEKAC
jgi:hypothetical protein